MTPSVECWLRSRKQALVFDNPPGWGWRRPPPPWGSCKEKPPQAFLGFLCLQKELDESWLVVVWGEDEERGDSREGKLREDFREDLH